MRGYLLTPGDIFEYVVWISKSLQCTGQLQFPDASAAGQSIPLSCPDEWDCMAQIIQDAASLVYPAAERVMSPQQLYGDCLLPFSLMYLVWMYLPDAHWEPRLP